jgi:TPR repeat protein
MSVLDSSTTPPAPQFPLRLPLLRFWRLMDGPLQVDSAGDLSLRHQCFFLRLEHALVLAQYVQQTSAIGRTVSRRNLEDFYLDENLTARHSCPANRLSTGSIQENGKRLTKGLRTILGSDFCQFESATKGMRRADALSAEEWGHALEQSLAHARPSFEAATNPEVLIQRLVNEARKCGVLKRPSLFQTISDGLVRGGVWICGWIKEVLASGRVKRSRKSPAVSYRPLIWTFSMIVLAVSIWWIWPHPHVPTRSPATTPTASPAVAVAPISPPQHLENQPERTNLSARAESVPSPAPVIQVGPKVSEGPQPAESKSKQVATEQAQHVEKAQNAEEARKAQEQAQKIEEARKSAEADAARQAEASKQSAQNADLAGRIKIIDSVNPAGLKNLADHDDADAAVKLGRLYEMGSSTFSVDENMDLSKFVKRLNRHSDPISEYLYQGLPDWQQSLLMKWGPSAPFPGDAHSLVVHALNKIVGAPCIYEAERFKGVTLRPETIDLLKQNPKDSGLARLNRLLLEDAYPEELRMQQEPAEGITRDYAEAVKWYRKAAESGNSDGEVNLGRMYGFGLGVQNDFGEALKWFRKAAEAGNSEGQTFLSFMYQNGIGVETNASEFLNWIHKAESNPQFLHNRFDLREQLRELEAQVRQAQTNKQAAQNAQAAERKRILDSNDPVGLKTLAEKGDAEAAVKLGQLYEKAKGVAQDYGEAIKWYRKAAEAGNSYGQVNLGWMYQNGFGVQRDYAEAVKWYRKAAEAGNSYGQVNLGVLYENGQGVGKDSTEALKWYRKAAEAGNPKGQVNLGILYQNGLGVEKDYGEALKWYRKAAEAGNPEGEVNLGRMYGSGLGVEQDYAEALKWIRKAAEAGNPKGLLGLGFLHENGYGVERDYTEALKWYRKAAGAGDSAGQRAVGYMYQNGLGVEKDYAEALKWYRNAAEAGDSVGQRAVGYMYQNGLGVEKDYAEALKWYRKAAEAGDPQGQAGLGFLYENGYGVERDYTEAVKWYRKAAEAGNSDGQKNLARMLGDASHQAVSNPSIQSGQQAILKLYREGLPQTGVGVVSIDGAPTSATNLNAKSISLLPGDHVLVFGIVNASAISSYVPITKNVTVEAGKAYKANMLTSFREPGMSPKQGKWGVVLSAENEKGSSNEVTWATFQFR